MKTVLKKILPEYFKEVRSGRKTFELRKDEDDIQRGDELVLKEWDGEKYTGRSVSKYVSYVLRDCPEYGLAEGYCIIALQTIYSPSVIQNGDNCLNITNAGTITIN